MTTESNNQHADGTKDIDPTSLAAIRNLLATEPVIKPQQVAEGQSAKAKAAFAPLSASSSETAKDSVQETRKIAERDKPQVGVSERGLIGNMKAKVIGYRPTTKHVVFGCLALLVFFRPWLMFGILFLSVFVMVGIFLILGYDGFWHRAMGVARWYAQRRPKQSVEMHGKLDRFAMKWDAVLDRFPEGSVDGLYLPDFGGLAEADARHDAALDRRFEGLRENGA